jgi:hypothetical protein
MREHKHKEERMSHDSFGINVLADKGAWVTGRNGTYTPARIALTCHKGASGERATVSAISHRGAEINAGLGFAAAEMDWLAVQWLQARGIMKWDGRPMKPGSVETLMSGPVKTGSVTVVLDDQGQDIDPADNILGVMDEAGNEIGYKRGDSRDYYRCESCGVLVCNGGQDEGDDHLCGDCREKGGK